MRSDEYEILKRSIDTLQVAIMELDKELDLIKRTNIFLYEKYIKLEGKGKRGEL